RIFMRSTCRCRDLTYPILMAFVSRLKSIVKITGNQTEKNRTRLQIGGYDQEAFPCIASSRCIDGLNLPDSLIAVFQKDIVHICRRHQLVQWIVDDFGRFDLRQIPLLCIEIGTGQECRRCSFIWTNTFTSYIYLFSAWVRVKELTLGVLQVVDDRIVHLSFGRAALDIVFRHIGTQYQRDIPKIVDQIEVAESP